MCLRLFQSWLDKVFVLLMSQVRNFLGLTNSFWTSLYGALLTVRLICQNLRTIHVSWLGDFNYAKTKMKKQYVSFCLEYCILLFGMGRAVVNPCSAADLTVHLGADGLDLI